MNFDPNLLPEKQKIELATAQKFLKAYNLKFSSHYWVSELSDSPDVVCFDEDTKNKLNLEITLLEDIQGDIQHQLGRGERQNSPTTHSSLVSFSNDAIPMLIKVIKKKMIMQYGSNTALVIRQTSPLWSPENWHQWAKEIPSESLSRLCNHFDKGAWILCTSDEPVPGTAILHGDDIFPLC